MNKKLLIICMTLFYFLNLLAYEIELEKNSTTQKLLEMLPLELEINELNGNEKYAVVPKKLPKEDEVIRKINIGDLMLYQNNYLVLFYKNFSTSYSYTKLGRVVEVDKLIKNVSERDRVLRIKLIEKQ